MNSQLIIVDGHSSVGKSSISKSVYQQINRQHPAYWLHEECENHPIRSGEFRFGALDTAEGMEQNRIGMLDKWEAFRDSILDSGKMCITEGCLLHSYDRYFIHSPWSSAEINTYCAQVLDVIRDLNPIIVLLYRPDLRKSLEKAFVARGQWWKDLILRRDDLHVYFKDHVYVDENSMFDAVAFEQSRIMEIFESLDCSNLKIDTSGEEWEHYTREIVQYSGLQYQKDDSPRCEMSPYPGTYRWQNGTENDDWVIQYDDTNDCLYTTLFWPYMPMRRVREDVFELISFLVELRFSDGADGMKFTVHGNYDWEYNEQVFTRVPEKSRMHRPDAADSRGQHKTGQRTHVNSFHKAGAQMERHAPIIKYVIFMILMGWLTGCTSAGPISPPASPTETRSLSGATVNPSSFTPTPTNFDAPFAQLQVITASNASELKLLKTLHLPGFRTGSPSQCSVAFSPDGKYLSGVCHQNTIPLWDAHTGQLIRSLESSPVQEVALAFSPDGKQIATGGLAGIIRVWDTSSGQMLWASNPLSSPVWELVFSPDGTKLASASFSRSSAARSIHLWNPMNGDLLREYQNDAEPLKTLSVDYAPDGKTLAYGTFDSVLVMDAELTTLIRSWTIPNHVGDLAFSADGQFLATGSDDHKIRLWQTSNDELQSTLDGHRHYVNGVMFSPDSKLIVSGSHDQKVGIWNVESGQLLNMLEGHENAVLRVAINPEGTLIASISWDGTIRLWGVAQ